MKTSMTVKIGKAIGLFTLLIIFSSCGQGSNTDLPAGAGSGTGISGGSTNNPASITLSASQMTVKSDGSDNSTITATILDGNNAAVQGVTVQFSADGGQISGSTAVTDSNGRASITFGAGTSGSNATRTITATVSGLSPAAISIQVTGTTITLTTTTTNLKSDGSSPDSLTITVKNAAGTGISGASVTLSVSGTGGVTLSASTGTTNSSGVISGITVTGTGAGTATVTVTAAGASATQDYTVSLPANTFGITSPTSDPTTLSTTGSLIVSVNAPGVSQVVFATSLGQWNATSNTATVNVSGGVASAVLTSTIAGTANVQVYDKASPTTSDTLTVAVSAPSSQAATISLQSNVNAVAPSSGGISHTATLTATVKTASNQVVSGSQVVFSIVNPTGGGETVSPVTAITNSSGQATTTFTSGTLPSDPSGVTIKAEVVSVDSDTIPVVIGGTPGSIAIGPSTTITSVNNDTAYKLPMSVLVSDSNGNSISGQQVTLNIWPIQYGLGYWYETATGFNYSGYDGVQTCSAVPCDVNYYNNEDANKNLTNDSEDSNGDGILTPPNTAAGSLPISVTTDSSGVGTFDLIYLKQSAIWIKVRVTARTIVQGTETTSTMDMILPVMKEDKANGLILNTPYCNAPHLPC